MMVEMFIIFKSIVFQVNSVLLNFLCIEASLEKRDLQKYLAAKLFSTLIRNVSWGPNQYIRMISKDYVTTEN